MQILIRLRRNRFRKLLSPLALAKSLSAPFIRSVYLLTQNVRSSVGNAIKQGSHALVLILDHDGGHASQVQYAAALLVDPTSRSVDVLDVQTNLLKAVLETLQRTFERVFVVVVTEIGSFAATKANGQLHDGLRKKAGECDRAVGRRLTLDCMPAV